MATDVRDKHVRTKLVNQGVSSLSDAELLSILLYRVDGNLSALDTAEALLERFEGNLYAIGGLDLQQIRMNCNLGVSQAVVISAGFELARRYKIGETSQKDTIVSSIDIVDIFQPLLSDLPHEECWAVYLNSSGRIIDKVKVSQGGAKGTVVDYKLIVKRGVEKLAHAAVIVHNHPSGILTPSAEDNRLTEQLAKAFSLFDILMLDHVIITRDKYYSYRENGFFDTKSSL